MNNNNKYSLSIVIPAFNEENRILFSLNDIENNFSGLSSLIKEVIVVSDGSSDNTVNVVKNWINEKAKDKDVYKIIEYSPNRGKGYAVREGFKVATGDLVIYTDADGASPILEANKLLLEIDNGFDVVCGSRILSDGLSKVSISLKRRFVGFVFQSILKFLGLAELNDTQCGFKLFKKEVVQDLVRMQQCFNFSFDIEYLYLSKKNNFKVKEVAINWNQIQGSKVSIIKDSIKMLYEVIKIRFIYKYN